MKPKFLLGLALLLSGVLFGCSTKPDSIDRLVADFNALDGLWENGTDYYGDATAVSPEELVSEAFQVAEAFRIKTSDPVRVMSYRILKIQKVRFNDPSETFTAVLIDTNLGKMIMLAQYHKGKDSGGRWWRRIYKADSPHDRYF